MQTKDVYELTNPQKSIWYMEEFYKGTSICNICGSLSINQKVDFNKLEQAIRSFVLQNKSFSIKLSLDGDMPKQYFSDINDFPIEFLDVNSNEDIQKIETQMVNTPFDTIDSLLFEFKIFRLPNGNGGLVLNCHHLIADACTFALAGNNIAKIYYNLLNNINEQYDFPSYLDYINSEKEYLLSDKFKKDEEYWNSQFSTIPDVSSIPSLFREVTNYTSVSKRESFVLPKSTMEKIRQYCSKEKISPFNFFMAIYSLYISRVSNLDEVVIGTPILNRTNFKEKNTCGMFISNVPLKICVNNDLSFVDFVSNIAKDSLTMLRHQKYPYQYLLENLRKHNSTVPNLYDNQISYQITKANDGSVDLPYEVHWTGANHISCGINIHLHDNNDSGNLIMAYDYLVDKYSVDDINSTHDRILTMINQVLESDCILLKEIEIVTPEEKHKILYDFNNTKVDYPKNKTIVDLFEEQVEKTPNTIALVSNNRKLTYKKLNSLANKLANCLLENNIKNNDIVGIMVNRSPEMIIGILAILKCGATYLPIDPEYPRERIYYMLENSGSKTVLVNDSSKDSINDSFKKLNISFNNLENLNYNENNLNLEINPNTIMYLIYTSGSTGKPKGVMLSHKNVHNFIIGTKKMISFSNNKVMVSLTTICFDIFVLETWCSLTSGITLVLANEKEQNITSLLNKLCIENNVSMIQTTPSRFSKLIEDSENLKFLDNIKDIMIGGEPLPKKLLDFFLAFKDKNIFNMYGPTETTVWSTIKKLSTSNNITIGTPISNTTCYILDKSLNILPCNTPGTLYIGGDGVSKGYYNKKSLTEEKFIKSPFNNNEFIYNTNDLACWTDNGDIIHLGRNDFQIKLNGYRIELGEIENTISSFSDINESVVICDTITNKLYAFYTSKSDINITDLKLFLLNKLPPYMVPYQFIKIDNFSYTPNGKLDRKALSIPKELETNRSVLLPKSDTEKKLFDLIKNIIKNDNFSLNDDFFSLEMDSINILVLSMKIEDTFNKKISPQKILSCSSILELSKLIDNSNIIKHNIIESSSSKYKDCIYPTSSAQKRIYYNCYDSNKTSISYNLPGGIILEKVPDIKKLEKCFNTIIHKHESFRTYFDLIDGNVVQKVVDKIDFELNVSSASYKDLDICFNKFLKPFDLKKAPLFRAELIKFENDKCLLLFDMHHIISDGTSLGILIDDLCSLYNNKPSSEQALTYKDFAAWENDNLENNNFEESKEFWKNKYNDEIPILNLPTNYTRPVEKSFKGAKIYKTINSDLTEKIQKLANKSGTTPYMILLSAYYILLSKYSAQDDIIVGSPIIGRDNSQLLNIIGMFVNTLPLRAKINQENSFSNFLQNVKSMCLDSFEHQSYPVDALIKDLKIPRDTSRNPLFDVLFTYQNNGLKHLKLGDIKSTYYIPDTKISKFDLSLEIVPEKRILNLNFEYCTKLFNEDFIQNLSKHYINILKLITENENIKISDIDILFNEEKHRILKEFNNNNLDYPKDKNLVNLFNEIVAKYPNNIAVQFGDKQITYKELDEKSNTLALKMLENGIKKGDIIGVCINKSIELMISIWAILKNSCTYMPMYIGYPKDRLEYMIENSNCKMLITNSTIKSIIDIKCKVLDIINFEKIENTTNFNMPFPIVPTDLAYIIYTSGSTGKPKGVKIMHKNLINYVFSFNNLFGNISSNDKFLSSTNISFDVSIWELFLSILNGSTLVLYTEEIINNILEYCRQILDYGITTLYIPPNILEEVYTMLRKSKDIKINKLLVGVEPIKKSTLNKYYNLNPNLKIVNGYGPTETTICSTALQYQKSDDTDEIVSIGKPIHNTKVYIVDKNLHPVPINVPGELCISGDGVGDGYINNDAENYKQFIPNPFDSTDKLYKTGDLAKWNSDGTITYISRKDTQVKFSGYRIELKEIDYTIMQYPSISKCLTTVYTNGKKSYLVTYLTSEKKINKDDLSAYLQTKLAFYMVPTIYIQLDYFPLTVNGKIDKKNLPTPVIKTETTYVAPRTDLEKTLCKIWQDLFEVEKIGIDDNFFDLGGDSLSAIRFQVEALNQNLNINYSDIFKCLTIRLLAQKATNSLPIDENKEEYDYTEINKLLQLNDISNIPKRIKQNKIGNILLTGATGFLGAHILDNYLSTNPKGIVYCFVRRKDLGDPEERLKKTLEFYFNKKYTKQFGKRIKVVIADITLDNFGLNPSDYDDLSNKIDIVVNSAALVKHYGDYKQFNSINVLGTQKLIDFCKTYNKKLYHISTTSVSGMSIPENNTKKADKITYFSEKDLYRNQNLNNTYIKTKFEAEKLILENINSGLNACIFRIGNISNRYSDAKFQINVSQNAFVNRIKSILKLQVLQEGFLQHSTEFSPVDLCADAIVRIIKSNPKFTVFHIFNNKLISFKNLIKYINEIGIKLDFVSDEEFSARVNRFLSDPNLKNEISGIITDLNKNKVFDLNANILLDTKFTDLYLQKLNFKWPYITKRYITKYVRYFKKTINYFN